jgi:hypothetical protein
LVGRFTARTIALLCQEGTFSQAEIFPSYLSFSTSAVCDLRLDFGVSETEGLETW